MILLATDLEKFHIESVGIEDVKTGKQCLSRLAHAVTDTLHLTKPFDAVYELLHDKRTELLRTEYIENIQYIEQATQDIGPLESSWHVFRLAKLTQW